MKALIALLLAANLFWTIADYENGFQTCNQTRMLMKKEGMNPAEHCH